MRIQHWLAPVWAWALMVSFAGSVQGQAPAFMAGGSQPQPFYTPTGAVPGGGGSVVPGPLTSGPVGAGGMVTHAGISAIPQGMQPWPRISPFENRFEQTSNQQGLWYNEIRNGPREYYFTLDALWSKIRNPSRAPLGDPSVTFGNATDPLPPIGFPRSTIGGLLNGDPMAPEFGDIPIVGQEQKRAQSAGMIGRWGFMDADDTGMELNGWYQAQSNWFFKRGRGDFGTNDPLRSRITVALPVRTGFGANDGINLIYDQLFRIEMTTESAGAGWNRFTNPFYERGTFKLRTLWGVRYVYLKESFNFRGAASGLVGTFDGEGRLDPTTALQTFRPNWAKLDTSVQSQMAGPQIGLHYTAGGDSLLLSGRTTVGLMANHERQTLNGQGFGSVTSPSFSQTRKFSDQKSSTHVSPLFSQTVTAKIDIFDRIPLLRELAILEQAKLRLGYSFLALGNVTRPSNSIVWQGQPLDPNLRTDREKWYIHGWNFGIDWRY